MVLDYSARKHASRPVEITWMRLSRDPASPWYCDPARGLGWRTEKWATPFSALRWAVPAAAGFQGRAFYMDADMLVLCDLAEIWDMPLAEGAIVAARREGDGEAGAHAWHYGTASAPAPICRHSTRCARCVAPTTT
ncbi:hypothetical protein WJ978_02485 [Achromobacter xylosoxidans]